MSKCKTDRLPTVCSAIVCFMKMNAQKWIISFCLIYRMNKLIHFLHIIPLKYVYFKVHRAISAFQTGKMTYCTIILFIHCAIFFWFLAIKSIFGIPRFLKSTNGTKIIIIFHHIRYSSARFVHRRFESIKLSALNAYETIDFSYSE